MIKNVAINLDALVTEIGYKKRPEDYVSCSIWKELVIFAEEALKTLNNNNKKYDYIYKSL